DGSLGTSSGTVDKPVLIATSATTAVLILAISGAGGASGDVTGPGSSTDGHLAVFDGTSGKTLKDGGAVPDTTKVSINAQTGTTYTLVLSDAGKLVTLTNGSAITLTVPTNASVAFATGTVIALAQGGAGTVTVSPASGVTINSLSSKVDLSGQYATASLTKTATDTWLLSGGLA
ncbi:MAG: hypothetical protein LC118_15605, partial [Dehalococcoidia bacterium]|nr:hypothetical protein [Dehalococcoidia bacterium]